MSNTSNNKRLRLLNAADELFLKKGLTLTTLADISHKAEVPLGNVYYYFKTKNEIVTAIINLRFKELQALLSGIERTQQTIGAQLNAFMQTFVGIMDSETTELGAMFTLLWLELSKEGSTLLPIFLPLTAHLQHWCENKFTALGKGAQAQQYAINFLAALYGLCVHKGDPKAKEFIPTQINFMMQTLGIS